MAIGPRFTASILLALWSAMTFRDARVLLVCAYNLDVSMPVIFEDPGIGGRWNGRGSYFGFSVALHNYSTSGDDVGTPKTWLLVGAPRANYSNFPLDIAAKQSVIEPGTLYKCSMWAATDGCTEVVLDSFPNGFQFLQSDAVIFTYLKNNGWVGVSLDAQPGDNGRIVVCGHLWKQQLLNVRTLEPEYFLPNGICYWMPAHALPLDQGNDTVCRLTPLMAPDMQTVHLDPPYQRTEYVYALGQAGTAINLPRSNPMEMIIGAPGVFSWRGTAVRLRDGPKNNTTSGSAPLSYDTTSNLTMTDALSNLAREQSQYRLKQDEAQFVREDIPQLIGTPNISIGDMWGYAVASGVFTRDGETLYLMTAPRAFFSGRAFIFDYPPQGAPEVDPLPVKWYFTGRQGGEYFGGSVCVTDVNSDGLDDVLVGAPLHSAVNEGTVAPDQGKVYVFLNNNENFHDHPSRELFGNRATGARFGYAISAIGDIDRDGFNDVAVGAPYENGQGAVYIYLGGKDGLSLVPQVVQGSFLSSALKGFGVSISRGIDMDRNGYPDLAIGAFLSGHAVVLRSTPVVKISGSLKPSKDRIGINDTTVPFQIDACLTYIGKDVPSAIEVEAVVSADFSYAMPRAGFIAGNNTTDEGSSTLSQNISYHQTLTRDVENCKKLSLRFHPHLIDFSKALEIRLSYKLVESSYQSYEAADGRANQSSHGTSGAAGPTVVPKPVLITFDGKDSLSEHRNRTTGFLGDFCKGCPVSDPRWPRQTEIAIPFRNDCGDDGCITDLSITASWVNIESTKPLVIGSKTVAGFAVTISARLEPAFIPKVTVHLPNFVLLTRVPQTCVEDKQSQMTVVECELPGPLYPGKEETVHLDVDLSSLRASMTELRVSMAVQSISEEREETRKDNTFDLVVPLEAQADIAVQGKSEREHFYYLAKEDRSEKERGKVNYFEVLQYYQITKCLPTPVDQIIAEFRFPVAVAGSQSMPRSDTIFLQVAVPHSPHSPPSDHELDCRLTGSDKQDMHDWSETSPKAQPVKRRQQDGPVKFDQDQMEAALPSSSETSEPRSTEERSCWRMDQLSDQEKPSMRLNRQTNQHAAASHDFTPVNCTSGSYRCQTVTCSLKNFVGSGSSAQLEFKLKIDLSILERSLGKNKTVLLVTQAFVRFGGETSALHSLQKFNQRPDTGEAVTIFSPAIPVGDRNIPTWLVAVSVAGGILLLLLITMGLMKAGFFHRSILNEINQRRAEEEHLARIIQQPRMDGDGASLPPPPGEPSSLIGSSLQIVDPPIDSYTDELTTEKITEHSLR